MSAPVIRKYKTTLPKNEITSTNYKETSWEISQQIIDDSARTDRDLLDCPKGLIIPINGGGIFANYISGYDFSDSFGNTNNTRPHGPSTGSQKGWTTICSSSVKVVSYSCNGPNSGIDHPEGPNSGDSGDPGCGDRSTNYGGSGHKIVNEIRCVTIVTEHQAVGPSTGVSLQDLGEEVHFTITEDNTPCELQEVRDGFIANRDNLNPIQQLLLNRLIEVLGEDNDEYCSPDYNGTLNLGNDIFSSSLDKTSNRSGLPNEVECPPFMDDITIATPTEVFRLLVLISRFSINGQLSEAGKAWISDYGNINRVRKILQFVETNNNSAEAIEFAKDLIDVVRLDSVADVDAFNFVLEAHSHNKIYNAFDQAFLTSVNQFTSIDTSNSANIDPVYLHFIMKCIALRAEHPDWSDLKIYWEASKDIVHLTLDALGLIPVFGEPADIINGVIYTFEGDALNASLSYAGAIPFVGWLSTGTKISIKVINQTTQGVIGLVWKVSDSGLITFGNRNILKHVIGSAGTGMHAHHIMPWDFRNNPLVQKAANSDFGFNMNELSNGFPLPSSNHLNGHNSLGGYNDTIQDILTDNQALIDNMNPNEAYNFLSGLTNHIKQLLETNQDLNLGQIADLINYP